MNRTQMMHAAASPQPPVSTADWFLYGSCRLSELDSEAWFEPNTKSPAAKKARAVCEHCPVRKHCLRDALKIPGTVGIWGGLDEYERGRLTPTGAHP